MDKSKVNMWLGITAENFDIQDISLVRENLEKIDEDKLILLQATSFQKPSTILLIAIFLGWERFWLEDIGLGIVKIVTCYGCGIWWLIDIFSAKKRAQKYNLEKFMKVVSFM